MLRAVCVLLACASCARAQTVEGAVLNAVTGAGIPGAKVVLIRARDAQYTVTADDHGHFLIEHVKQGAYSARFTAERYISRMPPGAGPQVQVPGGDTPVHLEARLIPCAQISGRVLDELGDPVAKARVDMTSAAAFWSAQTDAQGRFSLNTVVPGMNYTLAAAAPADWKPPDPEPGAATPRAWIRTFYPNVAFRDQAVPLAIEPAGQITNVEIRLLAAPPHAIRGVVLNPDGTPAAKVPLTLSDPSPGRGPAYQNTSNTDGTFVFPGVVYGDWRLSSVPDRDVIKPRASDWVEMRGRDIEGVKLRLTMPFPVKGRVILEAAPGLQAPEVILMKRHNLQLILVGETILSGEPGADGRFEIETVDPGTYQILPGQPPPGYYLDAVTLGETPVTADVELSPGSPEITVVYKTHGGTVRGSVEKCDGGQVLLFAEERSARQALRATCDTNGRYEISAIRPGAYKALAFPDYLLVNEEIATPFLRNVTRVTVRAGEVTQTDLTVSR